MEFSNCTNVYCFHVRWYFVCILVTVCELMTSVYSLLYHVSSLMQRIVLLALWIFPDDFGRVFELLVFMPRLSS